MAFETVATNMLPGDDNDQHDVFWRDIESGQLLLVSVPLDGGFPSNGSSDPQTDCEGYVVAFGSLATDLIADDMNGVGDVFVRDMEEGVTTRVSVSSAGEEGNGSSHVPTVSGDGESVAFDTWANNLVPDDDNGRRDVLLHDRVTGETVLISVSTTGEQGNGNSFRASLGEGGRYVAFQSHATNLGPTDPNTLRDIYVRDVWTETTTHVSLNADGETGNGSSSWPSISGDGTYIAFGSGASNLVPNDTNGRGDIFVVEWQVDPPVIERVSVSSKGEQANGGSGRPSISADGRFVAFNSDATNLVPEGASGGADVYVHDRLTHTTRKASSTVVGEWGNGSSRGSFISCDGTHVVFRTSASNLVPGDTNGWEDLYLRELDADLLTSGDGDCDGDIDFADFGLVQQCFTGDAQNAPLIGPECYALDFDFDGDVDARDFAEYLDVLSGPR